MLSLSALVAGASYATDCLFLVLADPCDNILLEHPRHEPSCMADARELSCCDTRKEVTVSIALYADDLLAAGPGKMLVKAMNAIRGA